MNGFLIGRHDLSCSLRLLELYRHPEFESACVESIQKARAKNNGAGFHWTLAAPMSMDQEPMLIEAGANLIIHSADIIAATQTLSSQIADLRRHFGDMPFGDAAEEINI